MPIAGFTATALAGAIMGLLLWDEADNLRKRKEPA